MSDVSLRPIYEASGGPSTGAAARDIRETFTRWPLWMMMSWQDIKQRYRGSVLGPFWLTLSMGVMIVAMGFVYSHLLKTAADDYFPFLTLGLLQWSLLATLMQEACVTFINSAPYIKQIRMPYTTHVMRTISRNLIIYAHNFVIYIIVAVIFGIWPGIYLWLLLPGFALLFVNAFWIITFLGMICARFRDIVPIINSLVQVVFFVTPVIWSPALLQGHGWLVEINPFYHMLELIRQPLFGHAPESLSYIYMSATAVAGSIGTFLMFRRFRARIAYWV